LIRGFTFERAISWPFTAPHAATFPWIFGLAYALVLMAVFGALALLGADDFAGWIAALEVAEGSVNPDAGFNALFGSFASVILWWALGVLASWILWAKFETASQRRYIRNGPFSLGFGTDEARMMVVGLLWGLAGLAMVAAPAFLLIRAVSSAAGLSIIGALATEDMQERTIGSLFGALGLCVLLFPLYTFFATRLAPCFGLTVRERKIRFFDAWNVSRGRAWSILGAYVILGVGGSIGGQVINGIAQAIAAPATMDLFSEAERGADVRVLLLSPQLLVPMGFCFFISLFVQGVLQHVVGGPAAFAVRHDLRGGIEEENQIEMFS